MRAWKERILGQMPDDEDTPLPVEVARMVGELKRVRTARRVAVKAEIPPAAENASSSLPHPFLAHPKTD